MVTVSNIGFSTAYAVTQGDIDNVQSQIQALNARQDTAHEMATSARELGLSEDSEVIETARSIWHSCEAEEIELKQQLASLQATYEQEQNSKVYAGEFRLTGYCPCTKCCGAGAKGITASGARATEGITVAADTRRFPFGTRLYIEGVGERVVQDRGGAIKGNRLDVFVSTHGKAFNAALNQRAAKVWVLK